MTDAPAKPAELRCWRCDKLLAKVIAVPYEIDCARCKATNKKEAD